MATTDNVETERAARLESHPMSRVVSYGQRDVTLQLHLDAISTRKRLCQEPNSWDTVPRLTRVYFIGRVIEASSL
jgi:hypothetical protein